jgi:hypothetical protein
MELAPSVYCDGAFLRTALIIETAAGTPAIMEPGQQRRSVRRQYSSEQGLSIEPPSDQPERLVFS